MVSTRWRRCVAPAIAAAALVTGCGGASRTVASHPTSAPTLPRARDSQLSRATVQRGKLLVFFKRVVGADPLASQLTVDTNGLSDAMTTYGGIEGNHERVFRLPADQLRRLKRLLRATRLHSTSCCDSLYYIYWVTERGRSWELQQGRVPLNMRPLILTLDGITNVHTVF